MHVTTVVRTIGYFSFSGIVDNFKASKYKTNKLRKVPFIGVQVLACAKP